MQKKRYKEITAVAYLFQNVRQAVSALSVGYIQAKCIITRF